MILYSYNDEMSVIVIINEGNGNIKLQAHRLEGIGMTAWLATVGLARMPSMIS